MALNFSDEQLRALMNDYYGGYQQKSSTRYKRTRNGNVEDGQSYSNDTQYYKDNPYWRAIGDELGININSTNDLSQLYNYFDENYVKGGGKKKQEEQQQAAASTPQGLQPGDPGFVSTPTNNYNNQAQIDADNQNNAVLAAQQKYAAEYEAYSQQALANKVKRSGAVSTEFYDQSYGVDPGVATKKFGHADLAGNLSGGQSATQLLEYFDSTGSSTLNDDQKRGKGGIYDDVVAMAELEKPLDLLPLPGAGGPTAKMSIPAAMVGNVGNASGIRAKRSKGSKYGRNSMGTSQFNRKSFGNSATSALKIGGLNI